MLFSILEFEVIAINILYPNQLGKRFDFDYYINSHMPMSIDLLSMHPGFRGVSIEKGVANADPKNALAYVAICRFCFDSVESFMDAFNPHQALLQNDMINYTDIEPIIQANEILLAKGLQGVA